MNRGVVVYAGVVDVTSAAEGEVLLRAVKVSESGAAVPQR